MTSHHFTDSNGVPCGGTTYGEGFTIAWQNGPLVVDGVRSEPNGAFVETIIEATIDRIEFYQRTKFACSHNDVIIEHLLAALAVQKDRTARRINRGIEGTTEV